MTSPRPYLPPEGAGDPRTAERQIAPRWASALACTVYLGGAIAVFWSAWRSPTSTVIGFGSDPVLYVWFFHWVPFAISHGLNPLVSNYLDFPHGLNWTWNGMVPLPAILFTPVTLTVGAVASYNLFATLAVAGSAWTAFIAIRRYVHSQVAAVIGGLLYGFSPAMMAQWLGHPHIATAIFPPLLLLAMDDILIRQRRGYLLSGAILGLLGAAQLYTGEEKLVIEVVVGGVAAALLASRYREALSSQAGYGLRAGAVAAALFITLALPFVIVQFLGQQRIAGGALLPVNQYVTDLVNFILPTSQQAFAPAAAVFLNQQATGNLAEWDGYIGLPLLGLLVVSAIRFRQHLMVRLSATLGLMFALLSMGTTVHVAGVITPIPVALSSFGFRGLRGWFPLRALLGTFMVCWAGFVAIPVLWNLVPARLMVLVFLFAGMLLAFLLEDALRHASARRSMMVLFAVAFSLLLLVPRLPYPSIDLSTPSFFTTVARTSMPSGTVALVAPFGRQEDAVALLWQEESGFAFKMPEGYGWNPGPSINPPRTRLGDEMAAVEEGRAPLLDAESLNQMRRDLSAWRVQMVIVGPMSHRTQMVDLFGRLLNTPPVSVGGVFTWNLPR